MKVIVKPRHSYEGKTREDGPFNMPGQLTERQKVMLEPYTEPVVESDLSAELREENESLKAKVADLEAQLDEATKPQKLEVATPKKRGRPPKDAPGTESGGE